MRLPRWLTSGPIAARGAVILAVAGALSLLAVAPAGATHSWGDYHWANANTLSGERFTLKLGDNVSGLWDAILITTSSDWTQSAVLDTTIVAGGTAPKACRPTSGRVEVCSASYGNTGWLGLAQIWITGGVHIAQGTAKVNDTYFNTSTYDTTPWRNLVMCQEVAHTFGLDHQDTTFNNANLGTCMDYTNDPDGGVGGAVDNDPSNEHPNAADYDELLCKYDLGGFIDLDSSHSCGLASPGHVDSITTVASSTSSRMPPAMANGQFDTPGEWGTLVRQSRDGRLSTYERDFGGGNKVVTLVIRA